VGIKLLVDVGYTNLSMASWHEGRLGAVRRMATYNAWMQRNAGADQRKYQFMRWLVGQLETAIAAQPGIGHVGICLPGPIDANGRAAGGNSLWGNASLPLNPGDLSCQLGRPVSLFNDLVAAATFHGPDALDQHHGTALVLNIGSGIGSKLYDGGQGRVVLGRSGLDGEIGYSVVDDGPDAATTLDGSMQGTLGLYSSGSGFARLLREIAATKPEDTTLVAELSAMQLTLETADRNAINAAAVRAARSGDALTLEVLRRSIDLLARAVHVVVLFNAPDVIVLTGGFFHALGDIYRPMFCAALLRRLNNIYDAGQVDAMVRAGRDDGSEILLGIAKLLQDRSPQDARAPSCAGEVPR
jgi:predicted NBD/HSP70 family sugar kinase